MKMYRKFQTHAYLTHTFPENRTDRFAVIHAQQRFNRVLPELLSLQGTEPHAHPRLHLHAACGAFSLRLHHEAYEAFPPRLHHAVCGAVPPRPHREACGAVPPRPHREAYEAFPPRPHYEAYEAFPPRLHREESGAVTPRPHHCSYVNLHLPKRRQSSRRQ